MWALGALRSCWLRKQEAGCPGPRPPHQAERHQSPHSRPKYSQDSHGVWACPCGGRPWLWQPFPSWSSVTSTQATSGHQTPDMACHRAVPHGPADGCILHSTLGVGAGQAILQPAGVPSTCWDGLWQETSGEWFWAGSLSFGALGPGRGRAPQLLLWVGVSRTGRDSPGSRPRCAGSSLWPVASWCHVLCPAHALSPKSPCRQEEQVSLGAQQHLGGVGLPGCGRAHVPHKSPGLLL